MGDFDKKAPVYNINEFMLPLQSTRNMSQRQRLQN